jgi:hypothetical protein
VSVPEVLARTGGRAGWAELVRLTSAHRVRRAVADGRIVRIAHGVYALPTLSPSAMAAARARGALCLESAATSWALPTWGTADMITVAVRRGATRPPVEGVRFRWCDLSDEEVADGRTGVLRTVLDCAAVLPFPRALAIADGALRARHCTKPQLLQAAEAMSGPGRARRLRVLRSADGRSENPFESALRAS